MCSDFSQDVRRIRDGNSFATRSVAAKQEGQWTLGRLVRMSPQGGATEK